MKFKEHKEWKKIVAKYLNKLKHDYSVYQDVTNDLGSLEVPGLSEDEIADVLLIKLIEWDGMNDKDKSEYENKGIFRRQFLAHAIVEARERKRGEG